MDLSMSDDHPVVYVVDDDPSVRSALERLFTSVRHAVETFDSAQEFLERERADGPGCLVLDVRLPGLSGLDLQTELAKTDADLPIVFITGHGDIPMSVRAIKAGAIDFLPKPFKNQDLLDAVGKAVDQHKRLRKDRAEDRKIQGRVELLTNREREVLVLVVAGMMNKQIARRLGVTVATIKAHRGRAMQKMQVDSLAELVRMAERAGISATNG
jgi:FixJ family two-component response regulator